MSGGESSVSVVAAKTADAQRCFDLAERCSLRRGLGSEEEGFLLGGADLGYYQSLFAEGKTLLAFVDDDPGGFISGGGSSTASFQKVFNEGKRSQLATFGDLPWDSLFHVQFVAVNGKFKRMGIGRTLYHALFLDLPHLSISADIIEKPLRNKPSIRLHQTCGFVRFGEFDLTRSDGAAFVAGFYLYRRHKEAL